MLVAHARSLWRGIRCSGNGKTHARSSFIIKTFKPIDYAPTIFFSSQKALRYMCSLIIKSHSFPPVINVDEMHCQSRITPHTHTSTQQCGSFPYTKMSPYCHYFLLRTLLHRIKRGAFPKKSLRHCPSMHSPPQTTTLFTSTSNKTSVPISPSCSLPHTDVLRHTIYC